MKGKLNFSTDKLNTGDVVNGELIVHPVSELEREGFYSIRNKKIGNGIQVLAINKIEVNENNIDVLVIDGIFIITNQVELKQAQPLMVNNLVIPVELRPDTMLKTELKEKKMTIVAQDYISLPFTSLEKAIMSLLFIILLYFGVTYYFQRQRKIKKKKTDKELYLRWNNIFESAKLRSDFEEIYNGRKIWIEIIDIQTPPIVEFNRVMHLHQYKEIWTKVEQQDVEDRFDNIRGIFK